ncbi:uncharacterized protein LOC134114399 [Pungitius pungitius]|uniref:uncharacterized protein LOC134114399 n=1 Tax=Pungitius pungitius TaxID=134920 RepID=UPI002E0DC8F8
MKLCLPALVLLVSTRWQRAESLATLVGHSVEWKMTDCPDGSEVKTGDNKVLVAKKVLGTWIGEGPYDGRIGESNSSSLVLTDVRFNDMGLYESSCGDMRDDLQVIAADDESVREGEQVLLKCYLKTDESVAVVEWHKDGKSVMNITASTLKSNGTGSERRHVSPDCFQTGNCSLSIEGVQKEDAGVYRCSIHNDGKTQWGHPPAVRMEVTNRTTAMPDTVNTPCPWETATVVQTVALSVASAVVLSVVLTVLVGVLVVGGIFWYRRPRRQEASPKSPDEELPLRSSVNRGTIAG